MSFLLFWPLPDPLGETTIIFCATEVDLRQQETFMQYHDSGKFDCWYLVVCQLWRHLWSVCHVISSVFCRWIERARDWVYQISVGTVASQNGGNSNSRCLLSFCWDKELKRKIRFSIWKQRLKGIFSNIFWNQKFIAATRINLCFGDE